MKLKLFLFNPITFLLLASAILCQGCKKFLDIKPSVNLIQTDELFASDAAALTAVSGVYVQMRSPAPALANGSISIYAGLSSDELATSSSSLEYDAFFKNSILAVSTVITSQLWASSYRIIYQTNAIIENLNKSASLSDGTKKQLLGEMLVVRALYYFYLVNLFGDVPLVTSSDYRENEYKPRTATANIYEQIIQDLKEAETDLRESYPCDFKARPNKWTAAALLAKTYLYLGDWTNAEIESAKIINTGKYSLESDLNLVFKNTSNEIIWQIAPANDNRNSTEGSFFIPFPSITPALFISNSLLTSFEPGDLRKTDWLGLTIVSGIEYHYPFKYKTRTTIPVDEYDIVFRLAEIYLIRAEARAHLNKDSDAVTDLNVIRIRAGLSNVSAINNSYLLSAIIAERQKELFAEWGNRWFDLKRTGLIDSVLSSSKNTGWKETDSLYPIPFDDLQINTALTQNPGY